MIIKNILLNVLALFAIISSVLVITAKNPVISVLYLISLFINTAGYLIILGIGFVGIAYILVYIGAITVLFLFVIMMINIKLVDIIEVGREYTKNLPLALSIGFVFLYLIFSISSASGTGSELSAPLSPSLIGGAGAGVGPESISIYPVTTDIFTNYLNLADMSQPSTVSDLGSNGGGWGSYLSAGYTSLIHSLLNPINLDINFIQLLQIEMLGQGLYTYGAYWLILSSIILLLSMIAPIILSTPSR